MSEVVSITNKKIESFANIPIEQANFPVNKNIQAIYSDERLAQQNILDREANRLQRGKVAKQIFKLMVWEISVIGILISGIAVIPYLNAFAPKIEINFPPAFLTLTLIFGYCFIVRYIEMLPDFRLSIKRLNIKKTNIKISAIIKFILIVSFILYLNIMPRQTYAFAFNGIEFNSDLAKIIFGTGIAVFAKTTILGKDIIKNLYELMKQHNFN